MRFFLFGGDTMNTAIDTQEFTKAVETNRKGGDYYG